MKTAPDDATTGLARWTRLLNDVWQLIWRARSPQWRSPSLRRSLWDAAFEAAESTTK
jgi:hypothetical protein